VQPPCCRGANHRMTTSYLVDGVNYSVRGCAWSELRQGLQPPCFGCAKSVYQRPWMERTSARAAATLSRGSSRSSWGSRSSTDGKPRMPLNESDTESPRPFRSYPPCMEFSDELFRPAHSTHMATLYTPPSQESLTTVLHSWWNVTSLIGGRLASNLVPSI
jgi:hypothetical protein